MIDTLTALACFIVFVALFSYLVCKIVYGMRKRYEMPLKRGEKPKHYTRIDR